MRWGYTDHDSDPATPCVQCVQGRYSNITGSVGNCTGMCEAGSYSAAGSVGLEDCMTCALGYTDHDSDPATPCIHCSHGQLANATGTVGNCTSCPIGTYLEDSTRLVHRACAVADVLAEYERQVDALAACAHDALCLSIADDGCDGVGSWQTCRSANGTAADLYELGDPDSCNGLNLAYYGRNSGTYAGTTDGGHSLSTGCGSGRHNVLFMGKPLVLFDVMHLLPGIDTECCLLLLGARY